MKAVLVVGSKEATFTPSTQQFLVKSMPRRRLEVIQKAGNNTKYTRQRTCSHRATIIGINKEMFNLFTPDRQNIMTATVVAHCWYAVAQCM